MASGYRIGHHWPIWYCQLLISADFWPNFGKTSRKGANPIWEASECFILILSRQDAWKDSCEYDFSFFISITKINFKIYSNQSISHSLPKTAYLKMIDIWLMFCLLIPFGIFMIEIVWQLNLQSKGEDMHFSGNCVLQCHTFLCQDITKNWFFESFTFCYYFYNSPKWFQ